MIGIRRSEDRGFFQYGNSQAYHTFSFGEYEDSMHQGFGPMTVINEDRVGPGGGFPTHPHAETEILSFILEGQIEYRDNLGNAFLLEAGDAQRATCGTGIEHSVFNASKEAPMAVLQCWFKPLEAGLTPSLEHWECSDRSRRGQWRLVASPRARSGSMQIHQHVEVYTGRWEANQRVEFLFQPGEKAWVQVTRGALDLAGREVHAGDGISILEEEKLELLSHTESELLLFHFP